MFKRFKDKAMKDEQKQASRILIVEAILVVLLFFWQLNPAYIIGSSSRSFYKMLVTFTPYVIGSINMSSVNTPLIIAVLLITIGMLVYIVGGAMILFEKVEHLKGRLSYAIATILQLVAIILIPVAKGKAGAIEGISNIALNQGYLIFVICFIITAWITVEEFKEILTSVGSYIVGFFEELDTAWYSIVGIVLSAIIFIIGFIPAANPIRYSSYQPDKGLIPTVLGGFYDYVIGLTQVNLTKSATFNAFNFSYSGFSKSYKLLGSLGFKVSLYSAAALLISLIVVVVGLLLSFVRRNWGSFIAFIGSVAALVSTIIMAVAGKITTTHNINYYSMFKDEGIVEVDYFPTTVPGTMGLVVFIVALTFVVCTLKAMPSIKLASGRISKAATKINVKAANVFTAIAAAAIIAFCFVPGLNILNISDKLPSESLISAIGNKSGYLAVFQDGIDNQFYQDKMISLLLASGAIILIGAVVALLGSILQLSLKNKTADLFAGCGVLATVIGFLFNLVAYTKITAYDTIMYGVVGTTISSFKEYLQAHLGNGIVIFAIALAVLVIAYGFSIKGTISLGIARIAAAVAIIGAFVPGLNPGRISDGINKNKGLWSAAVGFDSFIENFNSTSFIKALIDKRALVLDYSLCLVALIAIFGIVVGFCLSFGEIRYKRVSCAVMGVSSLVGFIAMAFMPMVCSFNTDTITLSKNVPLTPIGIFVYMLLFGICFLNSVSGGLRLPLAVAADKYEVKQSYKLFLMSLPFIALVIVFSYLPLWGWRYAFYDYTPGTDLSFRNWVGLEWFKFIIERKSQRDELVRVLRNTLVMSGLGLCTQVLPVIFAIFISEIRRPWFKKLVQTITTIPNFISWVLVYAIARALFESDGFINNIAINMNLYSTPKLFLQFSGFATCIWMLLFGIWKGLGWSAIIYIAAISGIDQQLYEAATVDGAGRFKRMWHITVPGLMPTFMVMFLMAIAGCLSNGMDQYLVFKTSSNKDWIEVLDYYVYRLGLGDGSIALATIVGMFKSVVSVILLFVANSVSKLVRGESIV